MLENVIGRTIPQTLNGGLFAKGPGEKDEGDILANLPGEFQCLGAVVARQGKIRNDQIESATLQCGPEGGAIVRILDVAEDAVIGQHLGHQFAIQQIIFKMKNLHETT